MALHNAALKVKREHIEKLAFIYVRQSTMQGVQKNVTGGRRQREDVEHLALELGWPKENIKIIDEDQARSGTSTQGRYGYLDMLKAISTGCVGAVFSLESTRLARDSADWHYLIKLCLVTGTLVIDPAGVYDANDTNDNTLMKMKALAGEMELHYIKERMMGAKLKLAQEGTLRLTLPTGFVHSETGAVIFDPDTAIQDVIRLAFQQFDTLGSALAVVRHFNRNNLKFPSIIRSGPRKGQCEWLKLRRDRILKVLKNPLYAGTFAYGRLKTKTKAVIGPGGIPEIHKYQTKVPQDEWIVTIHDAHPAYISWSRFVQNNERLLNNNPALARAKGSATRAGSALLQGLIVCGVCGYRMRVAYRTSTRKYYRCAANVVTADKDCQSMPGNKIERAVEELFLQAIRPVQLEISLDAFRRMEARSLLQDRQWLVHVKQAEKVVASLKERLLCVDYNNKYAFDAIQEELKKREQELQQMVREKESTHKGGPERLSAADIQSIETLTQNLPLIWRAQTTDMVMKKNLLRCLIEDVTLKRTTRTAFVSVRWKSGATTELQVELPTISEYRSTDPMVIDRLSKLVADHTPFEIADKLNEAGIRTKSGRPFTPKRVRELCVDYQLGPEPVDHHDDGRCSIHTAARLLRINVTTLYCWCRKGVLDAVLNSSKEWRLKLPQEEIARVQDLLMSGGLRRARFTPPIREARC